jgi:hypothetical protein
MGFFDAAVVAANERAIARRAEQDEQEPPPGWNDIAVSVPVEQVLWRTEHAAAALSNMVANPNGFGFTIELRWLEDPRRDPVGPHRRQAAQVGLILADGRRLSSDRFARDPDMPALQVRGGSASSGGRYNQADSQYWVTLLPPPGPLAVTFAWPDQSVAVVEVSMDAELIRGAAARALRFWDEQP